jgi:hypothetical protein
VDRAPLVLASFLVFLAPSIALADDANWSTFGGAGAFTKNPYIRMEREDVRITMLDEKVKVHATFWFRNRGAARSVRMGFPDETRILGDSKRGTLYGFRSTVDEKPVGVTHRRLKGGSSDEYRSAWVKTVPFARNGTRKVEVWYSADHGYAGSGWAFDTYVFQTGATWRGTIGHIATTVDWSKMRTRSRPWLTLTEPTESARWTYPTAYSAHLEVRNVEPKFDLDLTTIDGFWNFRLNGRRIEQNLGLPIDGIGRVVTGPPNDLRVAADGLGRIFGRYLEEGSGNTEWASPVSKRFGRKLTLVGKQTLVTGDGRRLRLVRPATGELGRALGKDQDAYVRLKDVFRALGGRYVYVPGQERVDLWLPRHRARTARRPR